MNPELPALLDLEAGDERADLPRLVSEAQMAHDWAGDAVARAQVNLASSVLPKGGIDAGRVAELRDRLGAFQQAIAVHILDEDYLLAKALAHVRKMES